MTMAQQSHFLPYLDNLVQSRTEEHRYTVWLNTWKHQRWLSLCYKAHNYYFLSGCHFCSPFLNLNHWSMIGWSWHSLMMLLNTVIPWPLMDSPGVWNMQNCLFITAVSVCMRVHWKSTCNCKCVCPAAGGIHTASVGVTVVFCLCWLVFLQIFHPRRRSLRPVAVTGIFCICQRKGAICAVDTDIKLFPVSCVCAGTGQATSTSARSCSVAQKCFPPSASWTTSACWKNLMVKLPTKSFKMVLKFASF